MLGPSGSTKPLRVSRCRADDRIDGPADRSVARIHGAVEHVGGKLLLREQVELPPLGSVARLRDRLEVVDRRRNDEDGSSSDATRRGARHPHVPSSDRPTGRRAPGTETRVPRISVDGSGSADPQHPRPQDPPIERAAVLLERALIARAAGVVPYTSAGSLAFATGSKSSTCTYCWASMLGRRVADVAPPVGPPLS